MHDSEKMQSAADDVAKEHDRLHQAVVNATPANADKGLHEKTRWKSAGKSVEKMDAANEVGAEDWAWGGNSPGSNSDEHTSNRATPIQDEDTADQQVKEEQHRLHMAVENAAPGPPKKASTLLAKAHRPAF